MNHKVSLQKVKSGKAQELLDWFRYLGSNEDVLKTLQEEGLSLEESFLFQLNGKWYCLYHMMFEEKLLPASDIVLNAKHKKKMRDCLEPEKMDVLVGFTQVV